MTIGVWARSDLGGGTLFAQKNCPNFLRFARIFLRLGPTNGGAAAIPAPPPGSYAYGYDDQFPSPTFLFCHAVTSKATKKAEIF